MKKLWGHKLFLVLFLSLFCATLLLFIESNKLTTAERISKGVEAVLSKCKNLDFRPECYDEEIPKLMDSMEMNDVFKVITQVQKSDPSYAYCHVVAHKLSFIESKNKPGTWKDVMIKCPFQMCNYGCMHGSLVEEFRGEYFEGERLKEVVEEIKFVCEAREGWNPSLVEKSMCYHGLGHAAMYIANGDVEGSLGVCREITVSSNKETEKNNYKICIGGVFMTVFQGVDPEDIALVKDIKPAKEDTDKFCRQFPEFEFQSCMRESIIGKDYQEPSGLVKVCSYAKSKDDLWDCVSMAINEVTVNLLQRGTDVFFTDLEKYCLELSLNMRETCFEVAALRLLQIEPFEYVDDVAKVCEIAVKHNIGDNCVRSILGFATSGFSDLESSEKYCDSLPLNWGIQCKDSLDRK